MRHEGSSCVVSCCAACCSLRRRRCCAQTVPASAGIYTCVDERGRTPHLRPPDRRLHRPEQRVLNRDGSLQGDRPTDADRRRERRAKDARERKAAEERAAQADAERRDRTLLARYPERGTRTARRARRRWTRCALAIKTSERRLQRAGRRAQAADRRGRVLQGQGAAAEAAPADRRQRHAGRRAARTDAQPGSRARPRQPALRQRTGTAASSCGPARRRARWGRWR